MCIRVQPVQSCPICGHDRSVVAYNSLLDRAYGVSGEWHLVRCIECGAGRLNPAPIADDLARCYVAQYYTHDAPETPSLGSSKLVALLRGAVLSTRKGYSHLQAKGMRPLGLLLQGIPPVWRRASFNHYDMIPHYKTGGKLFEIGCGNGEYLCLMRLLGWDVSGIDIDPEAVVTARSATKCPVYVGSIETAPCEPESFDVIVSSHVIEHVYDPKSFVAGAARLLKKGGVFIAQTPNLESLGHKLFRRKWFALDPPRHLCLFTPESLRKLLEESGKFSHIRTLTSPQGSLLAIRRRRAVAKTSNFLSESKPKFMGRIGEALFCGLEYAGNPFLHWGEQLQCIAIKA